jgi:hypothetical protein
MGKQNAQQPKHKNIVRRFFSVLGPGLITGASTTKIPRPSSLTTATHPQLQPNLLRRSAMISQYFIVLTAGNRIP